MIYVKGIFDNNLEPKKDPGYSDGVAIVHGVLRKPNNTEVVRDTVKYYLTPYWIENDYNEHMPARTTVYRIRNT